jgi:HAMP domain-containing protein
MLWLVSPAIFAAPNFTVVRRLFLILAACLLFMAASVAKEPLPFADILDFVSF